MNYEYRTCTIGDHESNCAHDWRGRKEKIAHRFELEDSKFDCYCDLNVLSDWLVDIECYFDWYRFPDAARLLFVRRKLVGSTNTYWTSVERHCVRHIVVIESWEEMKEKLKEKYLPEYYRNRLLDQLHNLRHGDEPSLRPITQPPSR